MVAQSANQLAKIGITIAIRYALQRRQFDDGSGREQLIMDYITHQKRLYPALAGVYAYGFALNKLKELFGKPDQKPEENKLVHILASGVKGTHSESFFFESLTLTGVSNLQPWRLGIRHRRFSLPASAAVARASRLTTALA